MMASGVTKSNMEAWMNSTHPDVRAKKKVKDALRQTSLLEYTFQSGTTYGRHSGANAGRFERECSFDGSFANDSRGLICQRPFMLRLVLARQKLALRMLSIRSATACTSKRT